MVKNLSRKSSTVFQEAAQDPLPPLPAQAASLRSGFSIGTMPVDSRPPQMSQVDLESMYEYMRQRLEQSRINESSPPVVPKPQVPSDHRRHLDIAHKRSHRFLREEQARLDALLEDVKAQQIAVPAAPSPSMTRKEDPAAYTKPFCDFLTDNPTVFHAVTAIATQLDENGFEKLSERKEWDLEVGGKYYVERNGSSLIAFVVGSDYKTGNGAAVIAGHVDALTARLKPVSQVPNKAGFTQLGVAPYAGALNSTWWDRDLGIGGRVLVREGSKIVTKLVKIAHPIARIPTLAPHFGAPSAGPFNLETQMVPIIGLENADSSASSTIKPGTFAATQPPRLVRAIARELGISESDYHNIVNWELELFDYQPATVGGLDKELIFAGRIDDKLCSWAALQALINSTSSSSSSGILKVVGLFDDEEIGSLLRQGARGNFLPATIDRAVSSLASHPSPDLLGRTFANSFLVSSDVTHAVNPNFLNVYLENHAPQLNVGVAVSADSNGHMTTDAVSTALFEECAKRVGAKTQVFQIRNDSRSGGTVGPMLSSATGMRAIDVGIPQLSMHSIRATTGSLDPGLGVKAFQGFLDHFEEVDKEFQ
ncbi:Aspartyl aminopeptidase [Sphaceloma murrayae]|uniref:Aspartyl aminopeptidase n=1 Tax=Sphaceloma murrayae TaxID=2082308 RepID=A0A2K1QN15_9PEZI|nr:Aspartyl aminopeptidase [Sphaceloma murrayae]